ncbi:MAG: cystathionine gamma-synthase [Frankiaceae bacterium]|nr:cystathionine gamma-synthase [Frankiaceae bacterium]
MTAHRSPATIAVTAGRPPREPDGPLNVPLVASSTWHAGGPVGYGRYGNPAWSALEEAVGLLEGGRAVAFSSGMAAVTSLLDQVPVGGIVVAPRHAYSGSLGLLAELVEAGRLTTRLVDVADTGAVESAAAGAALVWLESPTNPNLDVADVRACCAAARAAGAMAVLDSTFATPLLQRGLAAGAHAVVHSATKYLAGHSDALMGIVVCGDDGPHDAVLAHRSSRGAIPGALESFLTLRGLRTLHLRVERAQQNAGDLAARLSTHPAVARVRYPGLADDPGHRRASEQMDGYGAVVSIEVDGDATAADAVVNRCELWVHTTSLGGVESTLERRRRWPAESKDVSESLIRLSVGIEDVEDLWADLSQALSGTQSQ